MRAITNSPDIFDSAVMMSSANAGKGVGDRSGKNRELGNNVFGRRFKHLGVTPTQTAAGQLTASTILLLPVALVWDRPWSLPPAGPTIWLAVLGLALISTALAYIFYFRILASAGATNLLLVTFLIPISAGLLGITILGELLTSDQIVGMLLIGLGLAAIDGRAVSALRRLTRRHGIGI